MLRQVHLGKKTITNAEYSGSFLKNFIGMRFRKRFQESLLMRLPYESRIGAGIDMFFVNFPIDVVWMDSGKKIVDIRREVKPWKTAVPREKALYILEMPANSTKMLNVGNKLSF